MLCPGQSRNHPWALFDVVNWEFPKLVPGMTLLDYVLVHVAGLGFSASLVWRCWMDSRVYLMFVSNNVLVV